MDQSKSETRKGIRKELFKDDMPLGWFNWTPYDEAVAANLIDVSKDMKGSLVDEFLKYNTRLTSEAFWFLAATIYKHYRSIGFPAEHHNKILGILCHNRPKRAANLMRPSEATKLRGLPQTVWVKQRKEAPFIYEHVEKVDYVHVDALGGDIIEVSRHRIIALLNLENGQTDLIISNVGA